MENGKGTQPHVDGFIHIHPKDIITVREQTHGPFHRNAALAQDIKVLLHGELGWHILTPSQQEACDQIASKLGRALCNPRVKEHWVDIEGYAELAARDANE